MFCTREFCPPIHWQQIIYCNTWMMWSQYQYLIRSSICQLDEIQYANVVYARIYVTDSTSGYVRRHHGV